MLDNEGRGCLFFAGLFVIAMSIGITTSNPIGLLVGFGLLALMYFDAWWYRRNQQKG